MMAKVSGPSSGATPRPNASTSSGQSGNKAAINEGAMHKQWAEAKRRADELAKSQMRNVSKDINCHDTPSLHRTSLKLQRNDDPRQSGIHPLLLDATKSSQNATRQAPSGHSTLSAVQSRHAPRASSEQSANPYLATGEDDGGVGFRNRTTHRSLAFNRPGRHIRAAEEARRQAQMEDLKKRIQESARKAGMEELTAEERALRRPQPPEVEWWDQAFLSDSTYDAVLKSSESGEGVLIEGERSPIDIYIQHPIPIPAPSDKIAVGTRSVMLTKKEMKKMRRMRRRAEQEDKRDRVKMGLLPPDPPKVKLSNLMRVLTSEAVADPTKVEARVRREVTARKEQHDQNNLERMLTPDQRREKKEKAKDQDLNRGYYTIVFQVKHLVSPSHKFKVRKNAQQFGLTGITVFGKDYALIIVEGGQKGIKGYRHLMMNRIDWTDPKRPRDEADEDFVPSIPGLQHDNSAEQEEIARINWSQNSCRIIFEGPLRERVFNYGFKAKSCETDGDAKEALGPKLANFWDLAKRTDNKGVEDALL